MGTAHLADHADSEYDGADSRRHVDVDGFLHDGAGGSGQGHAAELLEAAWLDGAGELEVFRSVTLPTIAPTLAVVITTMVINVLKIFDIVYVMTGGNDGTEVIANRMYVEHMLVLTPGVPPSRLS